MITHEYSPGEQAAKKAEVTISWFMVAFAALAFSVLMMKGCN